MRHFASVLHSGPRSRKSKQIKSIKYNLISLFLSFFVIGRRRQLLEATRRTNFTTSTEERKLHLGFCTAETGQHGYFSAYSNRCDHRVRVQLLSPTAVRRGQRVTCQVGAEVPVALCAYLVPGSWNLGLL